jgi:hypothetical protein
VEVYPPHRGIVTKWMPFPPPSLLMVAVKMALTAYQHLRSVSVADISMLHMHATRHPRMYDAGRFVSAGSKVCMMHDLN